MTTYYYHPDGHISTHAPQAASSGDTPDVWLYNPARPSGPAPAPAPAPAAPQPQPFPYFLTPQYVMYPNAYYYGVPVAAQAPVPTPAQYPKGTPQNPHMWYGKTKEEIDRDNLILAQEAGATRPVPLVPQNAANDQLWWVREFDGGYTLRDTLTIREALQPGYWAYAQRGGYPYFIRTRPT